MKIIPWSKQEAPSVLESNFDEIWRNFWEPFDNGLRSRLPAALQARRFPPMNVSESENSFEVTLELPGLEVKDINIELMGNQLHISGERKWEEEKKGKEYHQFESQYGSFSRSLTLPANLRLDRDAIEATFQKGILQIRVPKMEPTPAAKIPIKAK